MDPVRFNQGMQILSAVLDGDTVSAERVAVRYQAYRVVLDDVDGGDFLEACQRAVNTLKWFPKPVELRECVQAIATERVRAGRAEEYAERVRLSDEALERERAATIGVWDPVLRVLVKADGAASAPGPLPPPEEGGVAGRIIDLAERMVAKGLGRPALPPPLSPEEYQRLREALLAQAAAYQAERGEQGAG
jgi:hypothetical protein